MATQSSLNETFVPGPGRPRLAAAVVTVTGGADHGRSVPCRHNPLLPFMPLLPSLLPLLQPPLVPLKPSLVPLQPLLVPLQPLVPVQPPLVPVQPPLVPLQPPLVPLQPPSPRFSPARVVSARAVARAVAVCSAAGVFSAPAGRPQRAAPE